MKTKGPNLFIGAIIVGVIGAFMLWIAPPLLANVPFEPKSIFLLAHYVEWAVQVFGFVLLFIAAALVVKSL